MRAKVNCEFGVVGENKVLVKESCSASSELTMCPLTSSISTNSHVDMGNTYPRRIVLGLLRRRLFGKQESHEDNHRCSHSSNPVSKISINVNSQKEANAENSSMMGYNSCNSIPHFRQQQVAQPSDSETGGIRNHFLSCQFFQSTEDAKSCTCCPRTSSQISQSDHQFSLINSHGVVGKSSLKAGRNPLSLSSPSSTPITHHESDYTRKSLVSCVTNGIQRNFSLPIMKSFYVLFILLIITGSSVACGPGRGAGRRRAPRKLTPLVYKQHVPNVPENTLSASGFTEGRITRMDQKFKNLVPNYNPDIIFRDEEGTGADRLMTQRCKEKLNTLAISVMNQWPGVKLRVIEGWDEVLHHATHSLHYEGRAVDITTSDKDRSKYGMLARLAVEAGFDWVYYESRAHIHCSVKSDSSQASRTGGCFSGNSTVETPTGPKKMEEIKEGDKVLTIDEDGTEKYSDVLMFLDRNRTEVREFFVVTTESGATLTLTPSHLLYSIQYEGVLPDDEFLLTKNRYLKPEEVAKYFLAKAEITFAKFVQIGDWVLVKKPGERSHIELGNNLDGGNEMVGSDFASHYIADKVVKIEAKIETGVYAPLTSVGNVVVDRVLTSCYAVIDDQTLAHLAFAPIRLAHNFRQAVSYLWKQLSRFISLSHFVSRKPAADDKAILRDELITGDSNEISQAYTKPIHPKLLTSFNQAKSLTNERLHDQGIHWYASLLYSTTKYILPSSLLYE